MYYKGAVSSKILNLVVISNQTQIKSTDLNIINDHFQIGES